MIGLFPEDCLADHWRVATVAERTSDEFALLVRQFLDLHGPGAGSVDAVAVSSVVPQVTAALRDMTFRYYGFAPLVVGPGVKTGMPVLYDNPKEVGADRIVNSVAAYDLFGGPAVVVDFGTATTLDAVSARGEYLGGAILPGIAVSLDALFSRAAGLRKVELKVPRSAIGRTTAESVQSGVIFGFTGAVDHLVDRFEEELGESTVVATGGLAGLIVPSSRRIVHHEPWLTLHGLRLVHERNG